MNLGFCRPQASAQGLIYKRSVHCFCVLGYNLNWCVMIPEEQCTDDASINLSLLFRRSWGRDEKVGK